MYRPRAGLAYDPPMEYDPIPTEDDLGLLGSILGCTVSFDHRILGGQSATTDILSCDDGKRIALRRHGKWSSGFDESIPSREAGVLAAVGTAGVPSPPVVWAGQFGDRTAIVAGFGDGAAVLDPSDGLAWADRLAATLVDIHRIDVNPSLARLLADAPASPVDDVPPAIVDHPAAHNLFQRRAALAPKRSDPSCLTHGDYWPGNVLWADDRIVTVLDWEAARVGDPAADVAYCAMEMLFLGRVDESAAFVSSYRARTGSDLASLDYWMVTVLCRGFADPVSFVDAWRGFGHEEDLDVLRQRQFDLIVRYTSSA